MYSFDDTVIPDYTMVIDDTNMVATTNYNDAVKRIVIPNYDSAKTLVEQKEDALTLDLTVKVWDCENDFAVAANNLAMLSQPAQYM